MTTDANHQFVFATVARIGTICLVPLMAWALSILVDLKTDNAVFKDQIAVMREEQRHLEEEVAAVRALYNALYVKLVAQGIKIDGDYPD